MIGSLFSGVGGLELGLEWAGLGPVSWQVEADTWCRGVLAMHWPDAVRHRDVRHVGAHNLSPVEVICGGFPCQDISIAGRGAGLDGARSGLWGEMRRVIEEIRPRGVVVENVRALVARGMDRVVADLVGLGYRVEGRIIAAADVGAPHRRERLFLVAHADGHRVRLEQQRVPRGRARDLRHGGQSEPVDDGEARGWGPKSGMGRGAHGVSARVDRWPARPGDPPALWEPPRAVEVRAPNAAARLHALGNAVVPQVAEVVGRRLAELLRAPPDLPA